VPKAGRRPLTTNAPAIVPVKAIESAHPLMSYPLVIATAVSIAVSMEDTE
jgi:hypothetical protein